MNPYLAFRHLTDAQPKPATGAIVSIDGSVVRVRTARGLIDAKNVEAARYAVGEEVLVRDGAVQGRVKPAASVPVYYV